MGASPSSGAGRLPVDEGALAGWPGTIIFVSHDSDFVSQLRPDRVLVLPEGTVEHWKDELLDVVTMA